MGAKGVEEVILSDIRKHQSNYTSLGSSLSPRQAEEEDQRFSNNKISEEVGLGKKKNIEQEQESGAVANVSRRTKAMSDQSGVGSSSGASSLTRRRRYYTDAEIKALLKDD